VLGGVVGRRGVLKLSGASGSDLWPAIDPDHEGVAVWAIAVDPSDNVVAAGARNSVEGRGFIVVKLNGLDGSSYGKRRCAGDCDGDGRVTVNEVVAGVGIALEASPICRCFSVDLDHNELVTISEVVTAVNSALDGCAS
jgi:hypothetical protein